MSRRQKFLMVRIGLPSLLCHFRVIRGHGEEVRASFDSLRERRSSNLYLLLQRTDGRSQTALCYRWKEAPSRHGLILPNEGVRSSTV